MNYNNNKTRRYISGEPALLKFTVETVSVVTVTQWQHVDSLCAECDVLTPTRVCRQWRMTSCHNSDQLRTPSHPFRFNQPSKWNGSSWGNNSFKLCWASQNLSEQNSGISVYCVWFCFQRSRKLCMFAIMSVLCKWMILAVIVFRLP